MLGTHTHTHRTRGVQLVSDDARAAAAAVAASGAIECAAQCVE